MGFIYALNFKMNKTPSQINEYMKSFDTLKNEVIICVPFTGIYEVAKNPKSAKVGAQNVSEFEKGAHTGEISAEMLSDLGVEYCIVGHSERRKDNHETDEMINLKIARLKEYNITPILCVGETEQTTFENAKNIVKKQLVDGLKNVTGNVIVAYEPVWAIGTGVVPTKEQIEQVTGFIKQELNAMNFNAKVLYGGSYNAKNYKEINTCKTVDGFLIGGASLKLDEMKILLEG